MGQIHFLAYRHISYVLPLVVLLGIQGLTANTRVTPVPTPSYRGAGWTLARKLGHDPERLMRLLRLAPIDSREDYAFGYGQGLTAILLEGVATPNHPSFTQLITTIDRFPPADRESMIQGAIAAFNPGFTPRLEPSMLPALRDVIDR
jgi:hypothetical protein